LSLPPASRTLEEHLTLHSPLSSALLLGPLPLLLPPAHPQTSSVSHSLSHLSNLLTTTSLLRNLPLLLSSKRQLNLPSEICEKHGIIEEDVIRKGGSAKGLKDGCWDVGTRGMDEMITVRKELKDSNGKVVPSGVMPLFLSAVSVQRSRTHSS
jgi:NADH dehydrogenase [ubiquinone] 1 alpha subcomplex assembly factor 6